MAQSTTAINACDASIWLDDDANTLQDISGSSNSVDINFDHDLGQYITFQSKWPNRLECGKDASFSIQAVYSTASDEAWDLLKQWYFATSPGERSLNIYLPDKNVGSDKFSCEARIENLSFTMTGGEADPIIVTATLLPSGAVAHTTAAT